MHQLIAVLICLHSKSWAKVAGRWRAWIASVDFNTLPAATDVLQTIAYGRLATAVEHGSNFATAHANTSAWRLLSATSKNPSNTNDMKYSIIR